MGLLGWRNGEESPLKQESMEILALDTVVSYNAKNALKGGETGRRESVIGCFGNPFLKETQRLVRPEQGKGSSTPGCSAGGLGKPLPHRDGGRQLPSPLAWPLALVWGIPPPVFSLGRGSWSRGGRRMDTAAPGWERGRWGCPTAAVAAGFTSSAHIHHPGIPL